MDHFLLSTIIFLLAAVLIVPLAKHNGLGAVLGYLGAGLLIGPNSLGLISEVEAILHFSELGVVLLLFLIGLELKPRRLWVMRKAVFGLGLAQVLLSGALLGGVALLFGLTWKTALIAGFGLALSSTAFALQLMSERGDLSSQYGRGAFAILLFQDLAVVPLLALVAALADSKVHDSNALLNLAKGLGMIIAVIVIGRFAVKPAFHLVARAHSRELFTAAALLVVMGTAWLMEQVGLSMALGAFLAGMLLSDSEFRHQLEADIEPFRGLLLGLFFMAVGMQMDLHLLLEHIGTILAAVVLLMLIKTGLIYAMARGFGNNNADSLRMGVTLSQGGEFAFVLFSTAAQSKLMSTELTGIMTLVVSISMAFTPLVVKVADSYLGRQQKRQSADDDTQALEHETFPEHNPEVLIIGFGRIGLTIARVLQARNIAFTAIDANPAHIRFARRLGYEVYYGDALRNDVLEAAGAEKAKLIILAINNPDISEKAALQIREHFPRAKLFARARNSENALHLLELDLDHVFLETYDTSLGVSLEALQALGVPADKARQWILEFRETDLAQLEAKRLSKATSPQAESWQHEH
ncbi:monovalent cation:proton antiporter-2 (CPA2) family protein [Pokkaliibacter sp. MBI-7]|uniref:monovalent cation:proton antiporter-2 (CPA2) family protein n=1 Tax=Pokkaliibacter sp. MBI-7 TaxID=3040600 RepID=UPI00244C10EC|nr:monovalent cation:proton antiporter-2 (CPA2) family protein [Pokkaliibacter sp. MBI-7]MDH2433592.1 monovalent cation:proton antiporter-2 (CPA2) family protein [Pokkaliibacter sp. MBI-7]